MPREFISEYGLDPGDYIQRLVNQFCECCPKFSEQTVEEAIFVDGGPIDYLVWFALDDYESHTFFYHDDAPDQDVLQRFIFLSPSREEMSKFKLLLQKQYGVYSEFEIARLFELPDIYQPQFGERPRANLGVCHEPREDLIVSGISGTSRIQEQEIFEDIDKIVPDKTLEKFISRTVRTVNTRIEEDADRHTITADIWSRLETDPAFGQETMKPLPKGIHPKYTDTDAELWQKPASKLSRFELIKSPSKRLNRIRRRLYACSNSTTFSGRTAGREHPSRGLSSHAVKWWEVEGGVGFITRLQAGVFALQSLEQ